MVLCNIADLNIIIGQVYLVRQSTARAWANDFSIFLRPNRISLSSRIQLPQLLPRDGSSSTLNLVNVSA